MSIYILTPELFIKQKAQQLVYFVQKLIENELPYEEVHLFTWDILEEWSTLNKEHLKDINDYESVFWYLFFIIQFEEQHDLISNKSLRLKVKKCCDYLITPQLIVPQNCIGIRP